ncbi:MAG: HAD family hydrolase [Mailhella sp.]|nr:HAD family hydrolase [Mailhella sp.]
MPLEFEVPGLGERRITSLVLDYNGTIADRGHLLPGVAERLRALSEVLDVHVFTADTFGTVRDELARELMREMNDGRVAVDIIPPKDKRPGKNEGEAKLDMLSALGAGHCCAIGNGRNDVLMLEAAGLSFCVMGREGCSPAAMMASQIACRDILEALDLLLDPRCCIATMRI